MDIITTIKGLKNLGMEILVASMQYTIQRGKLEKKFAPPKDDSVTPVGQLESWERIESGATFNFTSAKLEVVFIKPGLPRLTWTPGTLPGNTVVNKNSFKPVEVAIDEGDFGVGLESDGLKLTVGKDGSVTVADLDGNVIRQDEPPIKTGRGWTSRAAMNDDESFFGMGMKASPFSVRGCEFSLWNMEPRGAYAPGDDPLYISSPAYLSVSPRGSYLAFFDNSFKSTFSFKERLESRFEGGALRYYLFTGTPEENVTKFYGLVGHAAMPPRWALGYHQCRWSYENEAQVREIAEGFAKHDLPLSVIHMDIHYMDGYRVFTVDRKRFPDLKKLSQDMLAQGIRLVTILDPGVKIDPDYFLFKQGRDQDLFMKLPDGELVRGVVWPCWCAFPDFSDPAARDWWAQQYKVLIDKGISGFWHDMNEPAAFAAWGGSTLPSVAVHKLEGRGGTHLEAHNLYALQEAMAGFEGQRRFKPERRPWILSRSGWAGLAHYAWHWTGDSESNWWSLQQTIRIVLNLSVSGVPYSGADIGGFGGNPDKELYLRWFEATAMLPFFRVHSAVFTPRREPWCYDEETLDITRIHLRRRYSLLSYWYTLAAAATRTGSTLVRPLYMEDVKLVGVDDQFMVGHSLLAAPVLEKGCVTRKVTFPAGNWYDWETGSMFEGDTTAEVLAPLDTMPMFARGGSVVPVDEGNQIELRVFIPANDGPGVGGELYRDAGDGYGASLLETFALVRQDNVVTITRQATGDFRPEATDMLLKIVGSHKSVSVDGRALEGDNRLIPFDFSTITINLD